MILISHIEPLDLSSKYKSLSDLEGDYILKFSKYYQPKRELNIAIGKKKRGRKSIKKTHELAILIYLEAQFENILIKPPKDLHDTIIYFKKRGWQKYIYTNEETTSFGKELLEIYGYKEHFRSQVQRGIWLAEQLNIKTCPYCNAQYTILVVDSKNSTIAKFQFDHFFSKDKFPYLSLCLYNLIPCCANCNITKSKKLLNLKEHYHPYFLDFSTYFKFYLKYNPDPSKLTISQVKKQNFEIELVSKYKSSKSFVDEHNKLYHINGVFNRHLDIAEDLLMKAVIYALALRWWCATPNWKLF